MGDKMMPAIKTIQRFFGICITIGHDLTFVIFVSSSPSWLCESVTRQESKERPQTMTSQREVNYPCHAIEARLEPDRSPTRKR
jgi:hypothetical protein